MDFADPSVPVLFARVTPKGSITWSLRVRVSGEGGRSKHGYAAKGGQYRLCALASFRIIVGGQKNTPDAKALVDFNRSANALPFSDRANVHQYKIWPKPLACLHGFVR